MAETKPLGTVHAMEQQMIENKQGVFAPAGELRSAKPPEPTTFHAADAPAKPEKAEPAKDAAPAKPSVKAAALTKAGKVK